MHLKSLTVRGFKSFASATTFEFEPGLNAIVGPNGSGKSNVVDALAWVMGEQGAKSLRGGAMKDVIFAGGGGRPALGRARVELVIDNTDAALPLPYTEISLARTMFSAGGSEYEINGAPARLADVQELLSDSGLGRELHAIVGQGQLDRILHGTAADRRELIEQAAGLVKHRKRQDKTAAKLESLKVNLDRLEDLAAELGQQLEGRREQADLARSAASVAARVRSLRADLLTLDAQALRSRLEADTDAQDQARGMQEQAQETVGELGEQVKALGEQEQVLVAGRDGARALLARCEALWHRLDSLLMVAEERLKAGPSTAEDGGAEALDLARLRVTEEGARRDVLAQEVVGARQKLEALAQALEEAQLGADRAGAEVQQAQVARDKHREETAELTGALAAARAGFERAGRELEERQQEAQEAHLGIEDVKELEEARGRKEALAADLARWVEAEGQARQERRQAAQAEEKARQKQHEAEVKVQSLTARSEALEAALRHDGEGAENVAALEAALAAGAQELSLQLDIEEGWEPALAAALGPYADALVWAEAENQPEGVSLLLTGVEKSSEKVKKTGLQLKLEEPYRRLADIVTAPPALLASLENLLDRVVFCTDDQQARALLDRHPELTLATRQGRLHTLESLLYPGSAGVRLELAAELRQDRSALEEAEVGLAQAEQEAEQARKALEASQEAEKTAARTVGATRAQEAAARADYAALEARQQSASKEEARLADRVEKARAAHTQAQKTLQEATLALDTHLDQKPQADLGQLAEEARLAAERAVACQQEVALARAACQRLERQEEEAGIRQKEAQDALAALEDAQQKRQAQQAESQARRQAAGRAHRQALALAAALGKEREEHRLEVETLEAQLEALRQQLEEGRQELAGAQTSLAAALTLRAERAAQRARLEARWEALNSQALDSLGMDCTQLLAEDREVEAEREEIEAELVAAEKELHRLGLVNPLALEEFEALESRFSYLQEQIRDVKKSRSDLRAVMKDVSTHIEESFERAFEDVAEQFALIFGELFPGGEGKLLLSDPADRLASGVDIQARPAGKRVQRLSLLSGGERSLASLALLLAIFMARPAPFYVLDEVEAALDDRNLGRLLGVLGRIRERSQLLMITHHQRTMAQADTLYGVSMREGVSRVLSQRLPGVSEGREPVTGE